MSVFVSRRSGRVGRRPTALAVLLGSLAVVAGGGGAVSAVPAGEPMINEFSASTVGEDVEYVELLGPPGWDHTLYRVLEIEGDAGAAAGTIDEVITPAMPDASGRSLVNLPANSLENGTITLLLVKGFTGALNQDLDTDDDGVFDVTPWSEIIDAVAVNDGGAGDLTYGVPVLGVAFDGLPSVPMTVRQSLAGKLV